MTHTLTLLAVAIGGACGAVMRYLVGLLAIMVMGHGFPWGTLAVNVIGSFVMGVLVTYFGTVYNPSKTMQLLLTTGFLGAFTTFSAFSMDTVTLYERGDITATGVYIVASVVLSIAALFAGMALVRYLY